MITEEDRKIAHKLLDKLLDDETRDSIIWEHCWLENLELHRKRIRISVKIEEGNVSGV